MNRIPEGEASLRRLAFVKPQVGKATTVRDENGRVQAVIEHLTYRGQLQYRLVMPPGTKATTERVGT